MNQDGNELGLFGSGDMGHYPRGPLPDVFDERAWDENNFGGFKVDVRDTKDAYIIEADMPGLEKKNVDINAEDDTLTVSAHYDENTEQKDQQGNYLHRERHTGSFKRSFTLENMLENEVTAEMTGGILTIRCPKRADDEGNTQKINIR